MSALPVSPLLPDGRLPVAVVQPPHKDGWAVLHRHLASLGFLVRHVWQHRDIPVKAPKDVAAILLLQDTGEGPRVDFGLPVVRLGHHRSRWDFRVLEGKGLMPQLQASNDVVPEVAEELPPEEEAPVELLEDLSREQLCERVRSLQKDVDTLMQSALEAETKSSAAAAQVAGLATRADLATREYKELLHRYQELKKTLSETQEALQAAAQPQVLRIPVIPGSTTQLEGTPLEIIEQLQGKLLKTSEEVLSLRDRVEQAEKAARQPPPPSRPSASADKVQEELRTLRAALAEAEATSTALSEEVTRLQGQLQKKPVEPVLSSDQLRRQVVSLVGLLDEGILTDAMVVAGLKRVLHPSNSG